MRSNSTENEDLEHRTLLFPVGHTGEITLRKSLALAGMGPNTYNLSLQQFRSQEYPGKTHAYADPSTE